ncbi:MAG: LapA family protein [Azoarcus sp.]|jgi:uncharacterized integral membrane protein|nr:LapA family protein [Azoarcus sp.]
MRVLVWFVRFILFILLFGFAIKNDHGVDLYFYFSKQWHFQLVFIILVAFAVGALMGVTATVASLLRQRHEVFRLRKQLARAERDAGQASEEATRPPEPF